VRVALSNKVPVTPVRGAGHPQGTFAIERLLDRVARELKVDRAEVRRRNHIPPEKMPYKTRLKARGGQPVLLDSGDYPRCEAAEQLGADLANVTVTTGDTAAIALGLGGSNSRQTVMAGSSAHVAAVKVREKTLAIAAQLLEAAAQDLEIVGDHVRVKGVPDMKVGLAMVARAVAGTAGFSLPQGMAPGLEATEQIVIDDM